MNHIIPIEKYSALLSRVGKNYISPYGYVNWKARLVLNGDNWQVFIFFVDDIESAPNNFNSETIQRLFMFMPLSRYDAVIDILRNENPVIVTFNDRSPDQATIGIMQESVGENEQCCMLLHTDEDDETDERIERGFNAFEEHTDGHAWSNSFILALSSYHVYGGNQLNAGGQFLENFSAKFDPWLRHGSGGSARFDLVSDETLIGGTGLQAIVMSNDRYIIIAFRGTQTIFSPLPLDWMTNLAFAGAPVLASWAEAGVLIHNGWLAAVDKAYKELLDLIQTHRGNESKPLWITGHSLGGCLSLILALRLQTTGDYPVQGVHTYGAPPAGAGRYYDSYNNQGLQNRTQRWVNDDDIAPQLPLVGYSAVGLKNFIDASGNITLNAPVAPVTWPIVEDHNIATYTQLIRNSLNASLKSEVPFVN